MEVNRFRDLASTSPAQDPFYQFLPVTFRDRQRLDLEAITLEYETASKRLLAYTRPDGALITYDANGRLLSSQALDGRRSDWTSTFDAAGQLVETRQVTNGAISTFDADGTLLRRIEEDGTLVTYTPEGFIAHLLTPAGDRYVYETVGPTRIFPSSFTDAFGNTIALNAAGEIGRAHV